MKDNPINARDFSDDEKSELNSYILNSIPFVAPATQNLYPLNENILDKSNYFVTAFRVLNTMKNFSSKPETAVKLNKLLDETKASYLKVYSIITKYHNSPLFIKSRLLFKLRTIYMNEDDNFSINNLIDIFLVLSSKMTLYEISAITGLDLESDSGKKIYNDIIKIKVKSDKKPEEPNQEDKDDMTEEKLEDIDKELDEDKEEFDEVINEEEPDSREEVLA
jgi:hypothetical protein